MVREVKRDSLAEYGRACDSPADKTVAEMALVGFGYNDVNKLELLRYLS